MSLSEPGIRPVDVVFQQVDDNEERQLMVQGRFLNTWVVSSVLKLCLLVCNKLTSWP